MSKILRKFYLSADDWDPTSRATLNFQSDWLCDWWGDLTKKAQIRVGAWNIGIHCYTTIPDRSSPLVIGDCWEIPVHLDEQSYLQMSLGQRKRAILATLQRGITKVKKNMGTHFFHFAIFEELVLSNGLIYQKHIETRTSRDRKHCADLYCLCDIDSYRLCVSVRSGSACERPVVVQIETPCELLMAKHIGGIRWGPKNTLFVLNRAGQRIMTLSVRPNGVVDRAA